MLRARLATAAVAIPLLLVLIFLVPPWGLATVVAVLAVLAMAEYAGLAFAAQPRERALALVLGTLVILAAMPGPGPWLTAALSLLIVAGLSWIVVGRADLDRGLSDLGLTLVGTLYAGVLMPHFAWLHQTPEGPAWVTFVIATGMAGDTGGYFVGHAFGRHRLIPRVSPGKTVEGALGVLAGSAVAGVVAKLVLLGGHSWTEVIVLSLIMGAIGQIGDLGESVMKRTFGAKESGWIFPGHGGVLDRIDSLLFPVSLVYYYRTLFN